MHLRHRYTEANRGGVPSIWDVGMKAAGTVMASGKGMKLVGRAMPVARVVGGPSRKIGHIPLPMAKNWTFVRDVPAPPGQSFRSWWEDEHEKKSGKSEGEKR